MIAASELPGVLTAVGGLIIAVSGVASAWAAKRSSKVTSEVALIESAQKVSKDAIDSLKGDLKEVRAELAVMEKRHEECETARRKLLTELASKG